MFLVSDTYTNNRDQKYTNLLKEITYFLTGGWRFRLLDRMETNLLAAFWLGIRASVSAIYNEELNSKTNIREWCFVHVIFFPLIC